MPTNTGKNTAKIPNKGEDEMGGVRMGINVDIKRSDGRIHSAVVSGINVETKSVTVEWFERGETKGKEIELDQILGLNQDLAPSNYENANVIPNKLQKYVPRPSLPVANNRAGRAKNPARQSHVVSANGHNQVVDQQQQQQVVNNQHDNKNNQDNNHDNMPPQRQVAALPPEKNETVSKATAAGGGANRRRSNVVKEVERLKENREKRRAQQAQILEEKEAARNIDPGNRSCALVKLIRAYKDQLEYKPLQDGDPLNDHQITVCVRKRPLSQKECKRKEIDVTTCPNRDQVIIHQPMTKVDLTKYP